jgi:MucR family transcriptional regulator, transcriptional regulator of exopolysaccharide biosynthesis
MPDAQIRVIARADHRAAVARRDDLTSGRGARRRHRRGFPEKEHAARLVERNGAIVIDPADASYMRANSVSVDQIGALISSLGDVLEQASKIGTVADEAQTDERTLRPAVSIKQSIQPEFIVCLEDGKHARMLKRHLRTAHGMTPRQYRQKWQLPHDCPMAAPAYSEHRSKAAKPAATRRKAGLTRRANAKGRTENGPRTDAPVAAP